MITSIMPQPSHSIGNPTGHDTSRTVGRCADLHDRNSGDTTGINRQLPALEAVRTCHQSLAAVLRAVTTRFRGQFAYVDAALPGHRPPVDAAALQRLGQHLGIRHLPGQQRQIPRLISAQRNSLGLPRPPHRMATIPDELTGKDHQAASSDRYSSRGRDMGRVRNLLASPESGAVGT